MSYIGNQPTSAAFLTDTFSGTGSQTAFTVSAAPANSNSLIVAVSGVLQDPSTYSVSGTTLTFSAAPPAGTGNISVRFLGIPASGVTTTAYRTITEFTATAGQTTFTPPSYTVGFIQVFRNGVLLGSADYTATNGTTVVLTSGATAGDLVTTVSFYVSSVVNAIPATAGAVTDTYLNTGAVTQTKVATNVGATGPAFSAYASATQTLASTTFTKVQANVEEFDTNSNYDNVTNYRFTPTVAGYYQFTGAVGFSTVQTGEALLTLYKNGARFKTIFDMDASTWSTCGTALAYANGTTDYFELYIYSAGAGTRTTSANARDTYFSAFLARAA